MRLEAWRVILNRATGASRRKRRRRRKQCNDAWKASMSGRWKWCLLIAAGAVGGWASCTASDAAISLTLGEAQSKGGATKTILTKISKKHHRTRAVPAREGQPEVRLIGLDERHVAALFGTPRMEREQAPGKSWVYESGRCKLDLSFYLDVQSRVFRTLAYEVTSYDNSAEGRRLCVAELQSGGGARQVYGGARAD